MFIVLFWEFMWGWGPGFWECVRGVEQQQSKQLFCQEIYTQSELTTVVINLCLGTTNNSKCWSETLLSPIVWQFWRGSVFQWMGQSKMLYEKVSAQIRNELPPRMSFNKINENLVGFCLCLTLGGIQHPTVIPTEIHYGLLGMLRFGIVPNMLISKHYAQDPRR